MEYLSILLSSVLSFVVLFVLAKLLGKKQIAELDFADYVVGITIGSIAADWSFDSSVPWYHYLTAMAVFTLFSLLLNFLERKSVFCKTFLKGKPLVLITDGKIDYEQLRRSKLTVNDLVALCREKGFFDIGQVAFAIFENSGSLSVLPKSEHTVPVAKDLSLTLDKAELTSYLIIDGKYNRTYLQSSNRTEEWVKSVLQIDDEQVPTIVLASYDEKTNKRNVHYKNL